MSVRRIKRSILMVLVVGLTVSLGFNVWWFRSEAAWRELSPVCWPGGRDTHFLVGEISERFKTEVVSGRTFVRLRMFARPDRTGIRVEVRQSDAAAGRDVLLNGELATRSTQVALKVQQEKTGERTHPKAGDTCGYVAQWLIEPVGTVKKLVCYKRRCAATVPQQDGKE